MTAKLIQSHPLTPISRIKRRDFLGLGLVFSTSLLLPIALKTAGSHKTIQSGPGLAIGFLPLDALPNQPLISAQRLSRGDLMFRDRGAQVTIQRLYLPDQSPLVAMTAQVHYPTDESSPAILVPVWSYHQSAGLGAGNRLWLPVTDQGLTLSFDWQVAGGERETQVAAFALDDGADDHLQLQRGSYFIAGQRQQTGELPHWSSYQADDVLRDLGDRRKSQLALDFPYLLIQIDYGDV
jgi:hypothetical protein